MIHWNSFPFVQVAPYSGMFFRWFSCGLLIVACFLLHPFLRRFPWCSRIFKDCQDLPSNRSWRIRNVQFFSSNIEIQRTAPPEAATLSFVAHVEFTPIVLSLKDTPFFSSPIVSIFDTTSSFLFLKPGSFYQCEKVVLVFAFFQVWMIFPCCKMEQLSPTCE